MVLVPWLNGFQWFIPHRTCLVDAIMRLRSPSFLDILQHGPCLAGILRSNHPLPSAWNRLLLLTLIPWLFDLGLDGGEKTAGL
jgi:hypothetical protein